MAVAVATAALTLALTSATGVAAGAGPAPTSSSVEPVAPKLSALHFPGPFVPLQLVAASGRVWVLGTDAPRDDTRCELEEITPTTLSTRMFALPACATDIAAGGGRVYLVTAEYARGANAQPLHIDVFDPRDGKARILSPVVLSVVGSAIAHTDFTYGDGALWLYGEQMLAGPEVVRISPATGAVTATLEPAVAIGGIDPAVAANDAGLWIAGGPGGPPGIEWVPGGTGVTTTAFPGTASSSVGWLSAVGGLVWAGVSQYGGAGTPASDLTHLVALDHNGNVAVTSASELIGEFPLVSTPDGSLWGLAYIGTCGHPEELLQVDPSTGSSHPSVALRASPQACDDAGVGSQLASVGRDVFALIPTDVVGSAVLYRAAT